jgi:heme/copper-type cytochrome/quinol oxidase subunit 2
VHLSVAGHHRYLGRGETITGGSLRNRAFQIAVVSCACLATVGVIFGVRAQVQETAPGTSPKAIEVSAKKYEFTPDEIHVKQGTKVELKVHSEDETHGIKLELYPEGSKDKSTPGLVFEDPQSNGKVEKDQDQILDFVAQRPGTYQFKCAKVCGIHHGSMKGKLIVEE